MAHPRHILPGDRAALLGGAYTAISDDPSALYYNPGGLGNINQSEISLNILYSELSSSTTYKNTVADSDFKENSKTKFSSISGGVFKKGNFVFGYTFLTLDNRNINQNDQFKDLNTGSSQLKQFNRIHQETNSYDLMGVGAGYKFGKVLGLGVSLFYYQRSIESMDFQFVRSTDEALRIITSKIKTNNEGLKPTVGIHAKFDSWSLGLSAMKGIAYSNHTEVNLDNISFSPGEEAPTYDSITDFPTFLDEVNPLTLALGMALHPNKYFLLAFDAYYHRGLKVPGALTNLKDTYNYSIGLQLSTDFVALLLGAFTNNSMFFEPDTLVFRNITHIDYLGYSGGLVFKGKNVELTLGALSQAGEGKSQIVSGSTETQDVVSESFMYFAAAKYRF